MIDRIHGAVLWIVLTGIPAAVADETTSSRDDAADRLLKQFLERQVADTPVAGEFRVQGKISEQALTEHVKAARADAAQKGMGLITPIRDPHLQCRWAWDGKREMLESSPESNVFETFLSTPDGFLQGMIERNYNLTAPKPPYPVRPASFYFLMGVRPWADIAAEAKPISNDDGPHPDGTRALRLMLEAGFVRLFIREADYRIQGHELFLGEKLFHRMRIDSFTSNSDGRSFPASATLEVFHPTTGDLLRSDELTSIRTLFPTGEAELQRAFALDLPAGASVHDLLLNKKLSIQTATPAQKVMTGEVDRPWLPMEEMQRVPFVPTSVDSGRGRWLIWLNVILLAGIAAIFLVRAVVNKGNRVK